MTSTAEGYLLDIMSGLRRGPIGGALRGALQVVEPFYAAAMIVRNRMYDAKLFRARQLARPVISIGNLTTGGTGKTPMVRWLATRLRDAGEGVAVISRGYKSSPGKLGDEQIMLDGLLNCPDIKPIVMRANPNRVLAAEMALADNPQITVFLLDDAFQHRRVARSLDIVLLSATEPFGFDHVLPRGLLREPIGGLKRAGAVVITHADQVDPVILERIEQRVRRYNAQVSIYRAIHAPAGLRTAGVSSASAPDRSVEDLKGRRILVFCGLGNPSAFGRQLESFGATIVGKKWFADHYAYTAQDLDDLRMMARELKADLLLTTEKDWVKVRGLFRERPNSTDDPSPQPSPPSTGERGPEIWRVDVELRLLGDAEAKLSEQVRMALLQ